MAISGRGGVKETTRNPTINERARARVLL